MEELTNRGQSTAPVGEGARIFMDNLDPDFITELLSQPIYVVSSQPDEKQEQQLASSGDTQIVVDAIPDVDEFVVRKKSSPKGAKKAHKRVFVNKKKTSRTARRASSTSSSLSDDSMPNLSSPSPQSVQKKSAISSDERLENTTVCRFQCKVCGLTRFLVLRGLLPHRVCECSSSAVFVPCWVRTGSSSSGGGLGRECVHCPRCFHFYSSSSHLRRHKCVKQHRAQQTEAIGLTGVFEMPCCPHCNECFIFDSQLATHKRREHRGETQ
ncbi:Hypothetical predicted protein [Cloeon dipterum]|uniref:C2H2-type domain-containing protein n=1 Tax=Cloeon dipterum TaxID=197152 RepID=A0A8S1CQQ2_9INSE|nr:Hypothetical predicted protein [Cloeon dipterum]